MDIDTVTSFFMWCTIFNIGILVFWFVFLTAAPNLTYRLQTIFFPISRETFNVVVYSFFGVYKIVFIVFVLIPYLALLCLK